MKITRIQLRQIIREATVVPRTRGQNDSAGYTSGLYEDETHPGAERADPRSATSRLADDKITLQEDVAEHLRKALVSAWTWDDASIFHYRPRAEQDSIFEEYKDKMPLSQNQTAQMIHALPKRKCDRESNLPCKALTETTRSQLRQMIQESITGKVTNDSKGEVIAPFEYKVASAIVNVYEKHELEQQYQGTYATWPREVDRASSELEDALLDSGVLNSLLSLVDAIGEKLHNGEYASDIEREENIPPDPYGVADRHSTGGYDFYEPEDSGEV